MFMKILSFFDGMSCGQIAINKLGIKDYIYYASEVDKHAVKVTQSNYPNTVQLGDIRYIDYQDGYLITKDNKYFVGEVDLLIGGSPCTNLSIQGNREGLIEESLEIYLELKQKGTEFKGQSYLFWEYLRLLKKIKPKYFLLENVKMSKKWKDIISSNLKVEPIEINSCLLSSQHRRRIYWTNIKGIEQPKDKNITISDVVELSEGEKVKFENGIFKTKAKNGKNIIIEEGIKPPFTIYEARTQEGKKERKRLRKLLGRDTTPRGSKYKEYRVNKIDKFNCLLATPSALDLIVDREFNLREVTLSEQEKMQTVPVGYTDVEGVSKNQRRKMLGNGWTVDVIVYILEKIIYT